MSMNDLPKLRVYDNGGETLDRYTVVLPDAPDNSPGHVSMLALSDGGRAFSNWTEGVEGRHLGRRIAFHRLSPETQAHIRARFLEDFISFPDDDFL